MKNGGAKLYSGSHTKGYKVIQSFSAKYTPFFGPVHDISLRVRYLWEVTEHKIGLGMILVYMSMVNC